MVTRDRDIQAPESVLTESPALTAPERAATSVQAVLALQRGAGNQAAVRSIARLVPRNDTLTGNDRNDPEAAAGTLPFSGPDAWDGVAIAQQMSQLQPGRDVNESIRCVETSAIASIAQQGPAAIRRMMAGYVRRHEASLRGATGALRRRFEQAIENLRAIDERIANQTATFADLSLLQREMFMIFGNHGIAGTDNPNSAEIMRREGYAVRFINANVNRTQLATRAADLQPGEVLDCGVALDARRGTGAIDHAVHLGRHPDGRLYFYDPWPIQGDQMLFVSDDLNEIDGYFVNRATVGEEPAADATGAVGAPETTGAVRSRRVFLLVARYTPPADAQAAEGRLPGE